VPYPGDQGVTESASISGEIIGGDNISLALDEQFAAVVAIGVISLVVGHIADVDIVNSRLHGHLS